MIAYNTIKNPEINILGVHGFLSLRVKYVWKLRTQQLVKIDRQLIGEFHAKGAYVAFWADVQLLQDQANLAKQKVSFVFVQQKISKRCHL